MICLSYGIKSYHEKYKSKLNIKIYSTQTLFDLIFEEFEYHRNIIKMQLDMLTTAYIYQFIYTPKKSDGTRKVSDEETEAYFNATNFFKSKDFYNKLRIE
ncbi:MAG: hypothetical protein LBV03_05960 [Fusobacteriales bacterium]|jgi:hypothetical protein|nr:hypothetical protein [Fusobacteriales bacterium]